VARDLEEAARWFRISAEAGDRRTQTDLGLLLRGEDKPEELVRTRRWFEEVAFNFGVCLAQGVGVERDERLAAQWLRGAADGVVNAQYWYARLLIEGRGVEADPEYGRRWMARAAEAGVVDAQVRAGGRCCGERPGRPSGPVGAGKGHPGAMFAMGALNGGGHDVRQDRGMAQRWFRAAAERGHRHAQTMLGRYLARGLAGPRNPQQARLRLRARCRTAAGRSSAGPRRSAAGHCTGGEWLRTLAHELNQPALWCQKLQWQAGVSRV
jgi:uncharacterized protein